MKLPYAITLLLCLFLAACTLPDRFSAVAFQQLTLLQTRSTRFLQDAARIPWQKEHCSRMTAISARHFFRLSGSPVKVGINTRLDNLALLKNHYLRLYGAGYAT
ncbi:Putative outer membrane lipoprotein [Salmonella enterica]|nr:Putative outer membrane lipoprotein [Salmonella enterica]